LVYILKGGKTLHKVTPPAVTNGKIVYNDYSTTVCTDEQDVQNFIDKKIESVNRQNVNDENKQYISANTNSDNYRIRPIELNGSNSEFIQYVTNVVKFYKKYKESVNDINFRYK
jgi:hypothetical protein